MPVCKYCLATTHTSLMCFSKPRKPLQAKRRINKVGPVTSKWMLTRRAWIAQNEAPYYFCRYCNYMMTPTELTLDHWKSRSRYPELRYTLSNLVPCCEPCNKDKGSRGGDEYLLVIKERKKAARSAEYES